MARKRNRLPLSVYVNARPVGRLQRQASGAIEFRYHPDWLSWEHTFPISLSLPLREDRYIGDPVIAVFDNLLPDSEPIRRRVAERVQADGYDAYSILAKVGRDCVGAMQFLPEGADPGPAGHIEGRAVGEAFIARKIGDLAEAPLGVGEDEEFRISIAGAQEKTAFLFWKNKWHVPHGTTPTTHIMKPPISRLPNGIDLSQGVENEFLCLKLIAAFGLPSANAKIASFKGNRILVIERFDRRWTRDGRLLRLPQEDCCQALSVPPTRKYETDGGPGMREVLELLKGSDNPETDCRSFLKGQIMFWLLGATDGHAKNFSVFLEPGGRFRMTPIYDVMSAQPAVDDGQLRRNRMKLAMAVGDNRHYVVEQIVPRHFVQTATKSGLPAALVNEIFEEIREKSVGAFDTTLKNLPRRFPKKLAESIVGGFKTRLRLLEYALD